MPIADDYNDVPSRIREFREKHPEGSLQAADPTNPYSVETIDGQAYVIYTAAAYRSPDDPRPGIGIAWEYVPGKTNFTRGSEIQNAETSAWGRAIIAAGAADAKRIASDEEIARSVAHRSAPVGASPPAAGEEPAHLTAADIDNMTPRQLNDALRDRGLQLGGTVPEMRARLAAA